MSVISVWPPSFPFPPTPSENWNATAKQYLAELIRWRLQICSKTNLITERDVAYLVERLATPRSVRRFNKVQKFAKDTDKKEITYIEWLDRVVNGYLSFSEMLSLNAGAEEDHHQAIYQIIHQIVNGAYLKLTHRRPAPDLREELSARLSLALAENYFYDTDLEPWLWQTARYIILDYIRKPMINEVELDIDLHALDQPIQSGDDWLSAYIRRETLLEALRQISHRRYRVVLLLIYLFDLSNAELAAFFGVSIPEATTWRSRSLRALRKQYPPDK